MKTASGSDVMILACSGGSNVGQITNQAAVELTREGFGKMFCLAGVAAGLPKFVGAASEAPEVLVLDGCPVGCAKAAMANAGIDGYSHLVVTDLGIAKVKDRALALDASAVDTVKAAAKGAGPRAVRTSGGGCACGA